MKTLLLPAEWIGSAFMQGKSNIPYLDVINTAEFETSSTVPLEQCCFLSQRPT